MKVRLDPLFLSLAAASFATSVVFIIVGYVQSGMWLATVGVLYLILVITNRKCFQLGWLKGRTAMLMSMFEAQHRGMTFKDWLMAEAERDGIAFVEIHLQNGEDE